jgi:hypothetical protein
MAQRLPPRPKRPPGRRPTVMSRFLKPPNAYERASAAYVDQVEDFMQPRLMAPPTVPWPGAQGTTTYGPGGPWNIPAVGSPYGVAGAIQNAVGGFNQAVTVGGLNTSDLYKAARSQAGQVLLPEEAKNVVTGNLSQTATNVGSDLLNQLVAYLTSPPNFAPSPHRPDAVPVGGPVPIPAPYNPNAPIGPGNVSPGAPGTGYNYPSGPQAPSVNPGIPMFPPAYDPAIRPTPGPDPAIGPAWNPAIGAAPPSFPDPTTWGRRY